MKYSRRLAVLTAALGIGWLQSPQAHGESPVVVSSTRFQLPQDQVPASVQVISREDLERTQVQTIADALRLQPGISFSRSGGPGQQTAIYVRGAKQQHALVLIDGVRMNDQLGLTGYNMTFLGVDQIERIEVLKGPQSPLYGSDAMAGVINIITRPGEGEPTVRLNAEGGSFETFRTSAGVGGSSSNLNYNAEVSWFEREGKSARSDDDEKDGTENFSAFTRLGLTPNELTAVNFTARYIDAQSDYDNDFGAPDINFFADVEQFVTRGEIKTILADGLWEPVFGVGYLSLDRLESFGTDSAAFESYTLSADFMNTLNLTEKHSVILGADYYQDHYDFEELGPVSGDIDNAGVMVSYQFTPIDQFIATAGVRHDDHSEFGGETTWQASGAYRFEETGTRVKAAWGTGFKAPNSYQLFSGFSGNPDLDAETSSGYEVGIEQALTSEQIKVGVTYFHQEYEDFIDYDFVTFAFDNISEAETDGIESFLSAQLTEAVSLRVVYTYLDNTDKGGGVFGLRRPENEVGVFLNCALTEKLNVNLQANWVDEREDIGDVSLSSYTLVNLAGTYQVNDRIEVYGRIENLLDEDYETVANYNQDPIGVYAGIRLEL